MKMRSGSVCRSHKTAVAWERLIALILGPMTPLPDTVCSCAFKSCFKAFFSSEFCCSWRKAGGRKSVITPLIVFTNVLGGKFPPPPICEPDCSAFVPGIYRGALAGLLLCLRRVHSAARFTVSTRFPLPASDGRYRVPAWHPQTGAATPWGAGLPGCCSVRFLTSLGIS